MCHWLQLDRSTSALFRLRGTSTELKASSWEEPTLSCCTENGGRKGLLQWQMTPKYITNSCLFMYITYMHNVLVLYTYCTANNNIVNSIITVHTASSNCRGHHLHDYCNLHCIYENILVKFAEKSAQCTK